MDNILMDRAKDAFWLCDGNTEQSLECAIIAIQQFYEGALISAHIENERLAVQLENLEATYA